MRDKLIEILRKPIYPHELVDPIEALADYLMDNGGVVLPRGGKEALFGAADALADMVNQFGYSTTFRRKDAVCDGGLSALENAFWALQMCGCKTNSNGTITRENLWSFSVEEQTGKALKAEASLKEDDNG